MRSATESKATAGADGARRRGRWFAAIVALLAGAGMWVGVAAAAGDAGWRAPARLDQTGLYSDFATRELAPDVLPFAPQYPLWTDGAAKRRWIALPPGAWIDASDPDAWVFPVGTRIWKQFSFDRPVETRYMELTERGWVFATYLWSADGGAAELAPERGRRAVLDSRPGVPYDLPGRYDCLACHESNVTPVLGFSALQLSPERDPLAPHAAPPEPGSIDLALLIERGLLRNHPASWRSAPPRIEAASPRARAALGYLHGNCSSCHNDRGALTSVGLSLEVRLAPGHAPSALATAVGRTAALRPGGAMRTRIVPGDPEASLLAERVGSRSALLQMPPLGTHAVDFEAHALIRDWIAHDLSGGAQTPRAEALAGSTPTHLPRTSEKESTR